MHIKEISQSDIFICVFSLISLYRTQDKEKNCDWEQFHLVENSVKMNTSGWTKVNDGAHVLS